MSKPGLIRSLPDGTAWPVDGQKLADLEWDLRYADFDEVLDQRLAAAGVVAAYRAILRLSQRERNARVKMIRAAAHPQEEEPQR